jgi:tRNA A37 N6-isopentenylltransferase MiaA
MRRAKPTKAEEVARHYLYELKTLTKSYQATEWNDQYRAVAEIIHRAAREFEEALDE